MKKLELLKQNLSVETTEQLLDISEQPQEQCPFIDKIINAINSGRKEIESIASDIGFGRFRSSTRTKPIRAKHFPNALSAS